MTKAGYMRIGAMLAVLTVLAGAFAALPYWTARAADKTIWGLVDECNPAVPGPSFLPNVIVSLIDAHGIRPTENTSTAGDGSYSFTPATGSYILKFTLPEHYAFNTTPFRFDGSLDVNKDVCLVRMPTRTVSLTVLVVDQTTSAHLGELLDTRFVRTPFQENVAEPVRAGGGVATLTHHPVVKPGYSVTWREPPAATQLLADGTDYTIPDPFAGTFQLLNGAILASLASGSSGKWLNVSYQYSATSVRVQYYPVVPGSYTVLKNGSSWMAAEGIDWRIDSNTGVLTIIQNFVFGTDGLSINYSSTGAVADATVSLYNTTARQEVARGTTNGTGFITFSIWGAVLQLQVMKDEYQPYEAPIDTSLVNATRVVLPNGIRVFGIAYKADRSGVVNANVVGFLYNTATTASDFKRLIAARVSGALYIFYAEASQSYRMIIDADGYKAVDTPVSTGASGAVRADAFLAPSLKEEYRTAVTYDNVNWSRVMIDRRLILRPDTTVPGLELAGIRSLGLQIDYALGDRNGALGAGEVTLFANWLRSRLANYITTDGFLTTNGQAHNSTAAYPVPAIVVMPSLASPTAFYVNTTGQQYVLRTPPTVPNAKSTYYVNLTTPNDGNETVYQDQVVVVDLPTGYEMTQKKVTGPLTTTGWTVVTVDPGLGSSTSPSVIEMTVERSRNGTARAMVAGPSGRFHVLDDTLKNYTAVVAADTNITFSAEQSTDPIGNIRDANFTWRFTNNTNTGPRRTGYNITSTFNYSATAVLPEGHEFVVNLTVTEAGGNRTYRDIKVIVDDTPPVARIKTNRTTGDATGTNLTVDEDSPIKFEGSLSTDVTYLGAPGWLNNHKDSIPDVEGNRGYRWDYDTDHIVDSNLKLPVKAFEKPGWYNSTLQVMDWVGHTSTVNATIYVVANDRTKPTPSFVILDPSRDWVVTTTLIEGKNYSFNASSSSDNYDESRNLSYAWHFPGPVTCVPACASGNITSTPGRNGGWNVTVRWSEFNVSYNVTVNVTDTGFLGRTPNYADLTSSVAVSVDVAKHPDLKYVAASLRVEPGQPEEGQLINVSFMIENDKNRANATDVTVVLTAKDANGAVVFQNANPEWRDAKWTPIATHQVNTGTKVRLIFMISFPAQGNKSIEIKFHDAKEPYTWVDGQNRITGSVFVKLAGWVIPAAIVGFIALVIGVAFAARTYSRYRSGELVFRGKEKKEKKEKRKLEDEDLGAEPEEDTKGKKRL